MVGTSAASSASAATSAAFDPREAKHVVERLDTIPGPGEPGRDLAGRCVENGRRLVWRHCHSDPPAQPHVWGPGNAAPWPGDLHPATSLFVRPVIALTPTPAAFAATINTTERLMDWDEVSTPLLIIPYGGRIVKGLCTPAATALSMAARAPCGRHPVRGRRSRSSPSSVPKIDPVTGRTDLRPSASARRRPVTFCPGPVGRQWGGGGGGGGGLVGRDWTAWRATARNNYLYLPALDPVQHAVVQPGPLRRARSSSRSIGRRRYELAAGRRPTSAICRRGTGPGHEVWTHNPVSELGPILTTGGGLVFLGGTTIQLPASREERQAAREFRQLLRTGVPARSPWTACSTGRAVPAGRRRQRCRLVWIPSWATKHGPRRLGVVCSR